MSKILGSWSGMRAYLENDMLAPVLHGRVRYNCTRYVGMDNCHIFEVFIDGRLVKQFSWETVNSYFINSGLKKDSHPIGVQEYWEEFWPLLESIPISERSEYTDDEFCEALERYRNQAIRSSISSENPLVRMFAVLDRRVGKRTLVMLKKTVDILPEWLRQFYELRLKAELL